MSRPMPYVPMHPPAKVVTQEEMWAKLAKHCPIPEKPKEMARKPLEWDRPVRTGERSGYMLSRCGRYSISKDAIGDGVVYTAWLRAKAMDHVATNLGCSVKRDEAERLCNEDSWRE